VQFLDRNEEASKRKEERVDAFLFNLFFESDTETNGKRVLLFSSS
jgi:hypothetical protein